MEFEIVEKIQKIGPPQIIRLILAICSIIVGIIFSIIPVLPGLPFIIIGGVLLVPGKKIIAFIKIRKGVVHLFQNFSWQKLRYKIKDFKTHLKQILINRKNKQ